MCDYLNIPTCLVYYKKKQRQQNSSLENKIINIFYESGNTFDGKEIEQALEKDKILTSVCTINDIMTKHCLVPNNRIKHYKVQNPNYHHYSPEIATRGFDNQIDLEVVVSDFIHVRAGGKLCYLCLIVNLYNRKIIGFSSGSHKTVQLIYDAFINSSIDLSKMSIFHTDKGNLFKNKLMDGLVTPFGVYPSMNENGNSYDTIVAETTYKIVKTEFGFNRIFTSQQELSQGLFEYVDWYNNRRIHSFLDPF